MTIETFVFYILAFLAVGSAFMVILHRNPVTSALYLVFHFFVLGGLYLTLHAQFIAVIQILVYAGAIMVLFLFVIMLLNLRDERSLREAITWKKTLAAALSAGLLVELIYIVGFSAGEPKLISPAKAIEVGTTEYIGKQLFTRFLFPFEVTSVLLLAAIVGAVLLAKRKLD
ncbi:MAG TPA: NADH-quinone oxidoreductase subunit J [Bacteroidota bacterium]|nr:NADH-quinone oxidoreductase subunit J [Bacteroidota bacterium]